MEKNNESPHCWVLESNSSEDDNRSEFQMWERCALKTLSSNGDHNDDNIHEVQEQSQCHEQDCANESNKDYTKRWRMVQLWRCLVAPLILGIGALMMIMTQAWALKEVGGAFHFTNWICKLYGKLTFQGG